MSIAHQIFTLLFVAGDAGIERNDLCEYFNISDAALRQNLLVLENELLTDLKLTLEESKNTIQILTAKSEFQLVSDFFKNSSGKKLSNAMLEVLSIIAYEQPVTRVEIDNLRKAQSANIVHRLLINGLIKKAGFKNVPGKPPVYKTTNDFLDYFGITGLNELPKIDLQRTETEIELFNEGDLNGRTNTENNR